MMKNDNNRSAVLEKVISVTAPGGFILIADTPKHLLFIRLFFSDWVKIKDKKGFIFVRKP
jgi:hypothetical protein